mgnify:FL=1
MKAWIFDGFGFAGAGLVTWGLAMIYLPTGLIFAGIVLLFVGIFGSGFTLRRTR